MIQNDPVFAQLRADLSAQGYGDLASRNAALNRLFVGFGQVPDINAASHQLGISDLGQAIDPTTGQLAAENQFSTTAHLGQAHTDALRQIRQGLAARHALQSGELGYQLNKENSAYGQAQSDSTQQLLDAIAQLQGGYTAAQRGNSQQLNAGLGQATDRQIGLNPSTGSQAAAYDSATGLYKDANGNYWNPDGTPHVGGVAAAPAAPTAPAVGAQTTGINPYGNSLPVGSTNNADIFQQLGHKSDLSQYGF